MQESHVKLNFIIFGVEKKKKKKLRIEREIQNFTVFELNHSIIVVYRVYREKLT